MLLSQIERRLSDLMGKDYVPKKLVVEAPIAKIKAVKVSMRPKPSIRQKSEALDAVIPITEDPVEASAPLQVPEVANVPAEVVETSPEPIDLTDSGTYAIDVLNEGFNKLLYAMAILKKYGMTKEDKESVSKKMGVNVPLNLHARMSKFIKEHPEGPKSLVELAVVCIKHTMDHLEGVETDRQG